MIQHLSNLLFTNHAGLSVQKRLTQSDGGSSLTSLGFISRLQHISTSQTFIFAKVHFGS
ncbi:hypothetical protein J6590_099937 [Homalodisca vitripennis]|nr:hypothetical protein J6590_099937 [Homalodisca vitripennis]